MTLRYGGHRVWLLVYGSLCLLAALLGLGLLAITGDIANGVYVTVSGLAFGVPCFIARRARIAVDGDGLTIVNPFSSRRLRWADIADLGISTVAGVFHPIAVIDTAGRTTRSFGVMDVRVALGPRPALRRIAGDLAQRRARGG